MLNTTRNNGKLRILFITSDKYPPIRPAARAIFHEELVSRGHAVDWLVQAEDACPVARKIKNGDGTIHLGATDDGASKINRLRKHVLGIVNDFRMIPLVWRNKYDVIQVKDKYFSAMIALLLAKIFRVKYFYWLAYPHAEASLYAANNDIARYRLIYLARGLFFKYSLYKIILPGCDHAFVQSEQMMRDIEQEGIPASKMTPIPGSLNLSEFPNFLDDVPANEEAGDEVKRIIYLGTLIRERHLDFLIRVMADVVKVHPRAQLYLVGKGEMPEDEQLLKDEINRLGIQDSVIFSGFMPLEKAWELIRIADVGVSPYYPTAILNSTSPTKLVEYMAMGKPTVGNDHPEQTLVLQESGAGLSVPWQEDLFAQAIIKVLDNPEMAREMGIKGRKYVEMYRTNSVMTDLVEKVYLA